MANEILKRDQNSVPVLAGVTDDAFQEIRMLRVDPITGRLLITGTGGGTPASPSGSIQFNNSGAFGGSSDLTWNGSVVTIDSSNANLKGISVGTFQSADSVNIHYSTTGGYPVIELLDGDATSMTIEPGAGYIYMPTSDLIINGSASSGSGNSTVIIKANNDPSTGILQVTDHAGSIKWVTVQKSGATGFGTDTPQAIVNATTNLLTGIGTVTDIDAAGTIVGVGTQFTRQLVIGASVTGDGAGTTALVVSITDDTHMKVSDEVDWNGDTFTFYLPPALVNNASGNPSFFVNTSGNIGFGTLTPTTFNGGVTSLVNQHAIDGQNAFYTLSGPWLSGTLNGGGFELICTDPALTGGDRRLGQFNFQRATNVTAGQVSSKFQLLTNVDGLLTATWSINSLGYTGIQQTSPTGLFHLGAGTTARSPFKFTSGALKTSADAGAMEFLTDLLYFTKTTGTARGVVDVSVVSRLTAKTAAQASVATFTPTVDGSFLVSANVLVTTSTAHSFTVTCTYTDEGNTSRTITMPFSLLAGTVATAITNAGGAVPYEGIPLHIRAKASTAITIATTGTFTTVTYNVEGNITQIA